MKWGIVQLAHEPDKQKILLFIIIVVERGKSVIWSRSRPVYEVMCRVIRIVLYTVCTDADTLVWGYTNQKGLRIHQVPPIDLAE